MNIQERLTTILRTQLDDNDILIEGQSRLKEDLGLSSMQLIRLISTLESEFDINLEPQDYNEQNFISVLTVQNMITAYLNRQTL